MRDNYFEENRRMLVRHQADATTQPGVGYAWRSPSVPGTSHPFRCSQVRENGVPGVEGVRPAPTPTSGRADRGSPASSGRADGRQNIHLTRRVYTRYCHSGDLW